MREPTPYGPTGLDAIPDSATAYIPGCGETTVGAIRATALFPDPTKDTLEMWGYIATHPDWRPWKEARRAHA